MCKYKYMHCCFAEVCILENLPKVTQFLGHFDFEARNVCENTIKHVFKKRNKINTVYMYTKIIYLGSWNFYCT